MCEEQNRNDAKGYYTKVSALRAEVHTKDWADDKMLSIGGRGGYGYLSTDKIVKQIAPLLPRHGLETEIEYTDLREMKPCGSLEQHWIVTLKVTLVDIDTGYRGVPSTVFGEAADIGDKGLTKALTNAYKNWHLKFFGLADGMDPDADSVDAFDARRFARSAEEKEEAKSKVLEAARAAQAAKAAKAPAPAPAAPAKEPEAPAEKPAGTPAPAPAEKPAEAPAAPVKKDGFSPKTPQKNAINKILGDWETLAKSGKVTPDEYNDMSSAYLAMSSDADAVAFIKKYKRAAV